MIDQLMTVAQINRKDRRTLYFVATGLADYPSSTSKAGLKRLKAAGLVDSCKIPNEAKLTDLGARLATQAGWHLKGNGAQAPLFVGPPGAEAPAVETAQEAAAIILGEPTPTPAVEAHSPDPWLDLAREQADRFWAKVDRSGACWAWTAACDKDGYGKFQINKKGRVSGRPVQKHVRAHRMAWMLTNGPLSDEDVIMHSCDNPPCCNPAHLRIGTQADNVRDCADKNRIARGERHGSRTKPERLMRGETHYKATIDEDTVHQIRAMASDGRSWKSVPVATDERTRPLVRWAGGKGKLLKSILPVVPPTFGRYLEPFAGGLALFFRLRPRGAYISDANQHLVRVYRAVRDHADDLIVALQEHKNESAYYDSVRADFNAGYGDDIWRAAALIYMNRVGFNGVCRFNGDGEYNVPFGDGEPKTICDVDNIRACSALLQASTVEWADFRKVEDIARPGDFCYLDSPYLPENSGSFVKYTKDGFSAQDHEDVAALFRRLASRGVHVIASNSDTPRARELYAGFEIRELTRANSVNSKASARGGKAEILVLGGTWTPRGAS